LPLSLGLLFGESQAVSLLFLLLESQLKKKVMSQKLIKKPRTDKEP